MNISFCDFLVSMRLIDLNTTWLIKINEEQLIDLQKYKMKFIMSPKNVQVFFI